MNGNNDVEVLDFAGPFEVFAVTIINRSAPDEFVPFDVTTFSENGGMVSARNGLKIITDYSFQTAPEYDVLVIPGGIGTSREVQNPNVIEWIRERMKQVELMTSVCTDLFLLAEAGLLEGKSATTYWASIDQMRKTYPSIEVQENVKFVDAGNIISSAGINMAFHVVRRLLGKEVAQATAKGMEYDITLD